MARQSNEPTAIQENPEVYEGLKDQIRYFSVQHLATLGSVSTTTLYDYVRGKAVSKETEDEILRVIGLAQKNETADDQQRVERAKKLIEY